MYRYIGLLQQSDWHENGLSDGFNINGNSSLQSVAQFYGLRPPAAEQAVTVADYLASTCPGQPRIGHSAVWERVQLVVQEMRDATISKVRLTVLPLHDRRGGPSSPPPYQWHGERRVERRAGRS